MKGMINYPETFDRSALTEHQKNILASFFDRRKIFDNYLRANKIPILTCPGCGYPTLTNPRGYEICSICSWQDDYQDDNNADEISGGPNADLSLTQNRIIIGEELDRLAQKLGGKINTDPHEVLLIIARSEKKLYEILKTSSPEVELSAIPFKHFAESGQTFLWQLIETS